MAVAIGNWLSGADEPPEEAYLTAAEGGTACTPLYLRIQANGDRYDFHYGYAPGKWTALHVGADGKILSTRVAGGFVGATFGLYAPSGSPWGGEGEERIQDPEPR